MTTQDHSYDVVVIGAGIVGLATALRLLQTHPELQLAVIDKESQPAQHQTGHNSGVIHSGIYYRPHSLKAKNCRLGVEQLLEYCQEREIPYDICGKVIVATDPHELNALQELEKRAQGNGVPGVEMIGPERLREIEPHCRGIRALWSPNTGIIDFKRVCQEYVKDIQSRGGELLCGQEISQISRRGSTLTLEGKNGVFHTRTLVNCAGIQADRIAQLTQLEQRDQILPFRGEYYALKEERRHLVKGLIYPVPDPRFPFLGVHLTKTLSGEVEAGPNAVLAWSRNGYRKRDISFSDILQYGCYPGFWRMAKKYWSMGLKEFYRSYSKRAFLESLRKFLPDLQMEDLAPGGSGVRSQLVDRQGKVVDDFVIHQQPGIVHVISAPSPGATASLAIGAHISDLTCQQL